MLAYLDIVFEDLKIREGFRGMPYKDTREHLTVGYGTKFPLTEEEAEMLLLMRMEAADKAAHDFAPNFDSLTPRRKAVLVDMAYNMGRDGLFGFRRLQTALSRDDYDGASAEIVDSKYWRDLDTRPRATLNARIMRDG